MSVATFLSVLLRSHARIAPAVAQAQACLCALLASMVSCCVQPVAESKTSSDCTARALSVYSVGNQHGCRVQKVINGSANNLDVAAARSAGMYMCTTDSLRR